VGFTFSLGGIIFIFGISLSEYLLIISILLLMEEAGNGKSKI
jgi:hypothetical protein